jgi:hypothetical protein
MSLYRGYFGVACLDPSGSFSVVQDPTTVGGGFVSVQVPDDWDQEEPKPAERGLKFDLLGALRQRLPSSIQPVHFDARVFVFPLIPPAGTVEIILFINGTIARCCSANGPDGLFFSGTAGVEVSGGVGTSIGGNSGVRHGKRNWGRPRKDGKPNASRGKTYYYEDNGKMYGSNPPVVGNKDYERNAITRQKFSADTSIGLPVCPTEVSGDVVGRIGVSGFVSAGVGRLSAGAQFDAPIGEISLQNGVSAVWDQSTAGFVSGLGTGARIQVYGKAFGNLIVPLVQ